MSRFAPKKKKEDEIDLYNPRFPVEAYWAIYARQSSPGQVKNNVYSKEMQTEELAQWLISQGVDSERITLFDADLGTSGQKKTEDRKDLFALLQRIENDEIKAVAVSNLSRLFRDTTAIYYNTFAETCRIKNCLLMTISDRKIYNFNNYWDLKQYRLQCEMNADWLKQHVVQIGELRMLKFRKGLFAGAGSIPKGYTVDYESGSPTEDKYIPYKPHAKIVLQLFYRFFELDGDLGKLCRELEKQPFVFPEFDKSVDKRAIAKMRLKKVPGGYHITRRGLESMLTNPVYLGWWLVKGEVINKENHEPIIDKEHEYLFWFAVKKLDRYTPDGEINTERVAERRTYYQRGQNRHAGLLKGKIATVDGKVYVHLSSAIASYCINRKDIRTYAKSDSEIDVDLIDNEFCQLLFAQLRSTHDFDDYRKHAEELKKKHQSEQKLLKRQLEQTRKEQNNIIKKVLALSSLNSESIIEGLNEQHRELKRREADLEKRLSQQKEPTVLMPFTQLEEFHTQLEKVIEIWDRKPFDYKQRFINTLVEKVILTIPCPHWVRLEVHWTWKMPGWESKVLYIYRPRGHKATLTEAERQFLRENYLQLGRKALLQALPEKSWEAINKEALKLGLRRTSRETIDIPDTLTWKDVEFMEQEGLDLKARTTKCVSLSK